MASQFSANLTPGLLGGAFDVLNGNTATTSISTAPAAVASIKEVIAAQAKENGVNPNLAESIAFCESTTRQYAKDGEVLRGKKDKNDVGLFQINERYHLEQSKALGFDIYTSEGNIGYAMWLLKHEGSRHWNSSRQCWGV